MTKVYKTETELHKQGSMNTPIKTLKIIGTDDIDIEYNPNLLKYRKDIRNALKSIVIPSEIKRKLLRKIRKSRKLSTKINKR